MAPKFGVPSVLLDTFVPLAPAATWMTSAISVLEMGDRAVMPVGAVHVTLALSANPATSISFAAVVVREAAVGFPAPPAPSRLDTSTGVVLSTPIYAAIMPWAAPVNV